MRLIYGGVLGGVSEGACGWVVVSEGEVKDTERKNTHTQ